MRTKFPPTVMIFGVVEDSKGQIMTTPFLPQGLRVNADAGAYVETLQTTAVGLYWIDSAVNEGRPCVYRKDSVRAHKAPKTQDWMDSQEFSSSCHTKLLMAAF
ncbi:hypothetical protein ACTXT7_008475 [Hymenolepis weldensis]